MRFHFSTNRKELAYLTFIITVDRDWENWTTMTYLWPIRKLWFSGNCHLLIWRQNHLGDTYWRKVAVSLKKKLLNLKLEGTPKWYFDELLEQSVEIGECEASGSCTLKGSLPVSILESHHKLVTRMRKILSCIWEVARSRENHFEIDSGLLHNEDQYSKEIPDRVLC